MKRFLTGLWRFFCVPLVVLAAGVAVALMKWILPHGTGKCWWLLAITSVIGFFAGMYLLRNIPKKWLIPSALIACALSAVAQLMGLTATLMPNLYQVMAVYLNMLFYLSRLLLKLFGNGTAVIFASVVAEILIPLLYVFSGLFGKPATAQETAGTDQTSNGGNL